MYPSHQLSIVLVCAFIGVPLSMQQCVYQECICSGTTIMCDARRLTTMPVLIPSDVHYKNLDLSMNAITDIPTGSLPLNLTDLMLMGNPITTIAETAFDGSAYTMENIYLSSPGFTRLPDAFGHLKAFKYLNIAEANITDWNEDVMRQIGQTMTSLSLENVGLTTWPNWLQSFSQLTDLTISRGTISSLPDNALDNVSKTLTRLSLYWNTLVAVPKAFSKLSALQDLNLGDNKIVDVTWLPQRSKLTNLLLNNNLIADAKILSNAVRPFGDYLLTFDIYSNRLTSIPNFTYIKQIKYLDLTYNKLIDPTSGAFVPSVVTVLFGHNFLPSIPRVLSTLHSLDDLILSFNSIKQIHASDFPPLATGVELDYNLITELTDNSFPINSMIKSLRLNNNPITTISSLAFRNLVYLLDLNLQSTRLSRLPLALSSLTNLYTLNMANTATLVCTCQEKSLQTWIISNKQATIEGNCGLTDIRSFFSELSPLCP